MHAFARLRYLPDKQLLHNICRCGGMGRGVGVGVGVGVGMGV